MTDVAQPTAPPDRPPAHALSRNPDQSTAFDEDIAKQVTYPHLAPARHVVPLNTPAALVVGDNKLSFGRRCRNYTVQNNTAATIYRELDGVATLGSMAIPAGATLYEDKYVRDLHIYVTVAGVANGTVAGVVVEGGA